MIVLVLLHEDKQSYSPSALLGSYKQFLLPFSLYKQDLLRFACEFQASIKFYMVVLVFLHEIERSSGPSELLISYKQFLVTFRRDRPELRSNSLRSTISIL